ncbi:transporter [Virgibacillus sp. L01]|uniref:transporter n=1 Tax=Virgibacillus sp. L01 TaxID=3457429 RepID=UPI003FD3677B
MQKMAKIAYESIMILLVMLTIITLWTQNTYSSTINWIVWGVFFIDFFFRLLTAKKKWDFIKQNPFLLIAIIPFDQFFQVARVVRVIYLFRIKTIAKYYIAPYVEKLTFQSKSLIVSILLSLMVAASFVIWNLESSIVAYYDALYVIIGYLLFFGHRVFEIEGQVSIWILTGISIIGIAIQGLALQWAFNKVEVLFNNFKKKKQTVSQEHNSEEAN